MAELPPKPERGPDQQQLAEDIHRSCRSVRARFMRAHGRSVYDALTNGRAECLRLGELAFAAAEGFPGLVPTKAQIAGERGHIQIDKEGREIDQGIFFWGLLRSSDVGIHLMDSMRRPTARALLLLPEFRRLGELNLGVVRIERRDHAAHLTVQNDRYLNAEDDGLTEDLETAVDLTLLDDGIRVGVMRGGAMMHRRYLGRRVFSSGINLVHLHDGQISFVDFLLRREFGFISKILRGLSTEEHLQSCGPHTAEKPWVAAVDSFAIGGGAQLLLVFDRVIAGADSYFCLPAAREGIVPGAASLRLGRFTGPRIARQIILWGRKVWASEPDAKLLFDEIVDPSRMDVAIASSVDALDSSAVVANRRMLNLAEEPLDAFREYMAAFALDQASRIYSSDVMAKVGQAWARSPRR